MTHMIAQTILPGARRTFDLSKALMKGVDAAAAARFPNGVRTNHPTFVYGHLSIYPDRLFRLMGREDLTRPDERYEELFSPYAECADDPFSAVYPEFAQVCERFAERTGAVLTFLESAPDSLLASPNEGPSKEAFPTVGVLATFLLQAHAMLHLGQVSAWRRIMGLGEAMPRPKPPMAAKG